MLNFLSKFNLWIRLPALFLLFAGILPFLTAGTPVEFAIAHGFFAPIALSIGSMALGILFVVVVGTACNMMGVSPEQRAGMWVTMTTLSVVFMTFAFWAGAALLPDIYTISGFFGALVTSVAFNVMLMLTFPRSNRSTTNAS